MKIPIAQLYIVLIASLLAACASPNVQLLGTGLASDKQRVNLTPQTLTNTDKTDTGTERLTVYPEFQTAIVSTNMAAKDAVDLFTAPTEKIRSHATLMPTSETSIPMTIAKQQRVGFVAFEVGVYDHLSYYRAESIIKLLQAVPEQTQIILTGHSHSRQQLASQRLAQIRATSLQNILVRNGINPQQILVLTDVVNQRRQGQLLHGVTVHTRSLQTPSWPVARVQAVPQSGSSNSTPVKQRPQAVSATSSKPDIIDQHIGFVAFAIGKYRQPAESNTIPIKNII